MSAPALEDLRQQIGLLGARPFHNQVVQSPWNQVIDAEELHQPVKAKIRELLVRSGEADAPRCLTAHAPSGYGKTHVLAWTRQFLEDDKHGLFVYVSPYKPDLGSLERHILRCTLESLRRRSHKQRERFDQAVQSYLVRQYDDFVAHQRSLKDLRAGGFWRRLLRRSSLKIGSRSADEQRAALQRAFHRPTLLQHAYANLARELEQGPVQADGVQLDWDAFVAACLVACGDEVRRWCADAWFGKDDQIPAAVFDTAHLRQRCEGGAKLLNTLFTLQRLTGHVFCLAFDQMEDTYHEMEKAGQDGGVLGQSLAALIRQLSATPRFCQLFMFQTSIWIDFTRPDKAPRQLVDRMTTDFGVQELTALTDRTACPLVQRRMDLFVWRELKGKASPDGNPYFPFTTEDIHRLRRDAAGEMRSFLRMAQKRYEELIEKPLSLPPIKLLRLEPAEVMSTDPTPVVIHGQHLPPLVEVTFAGGPAIQLASQAAQGTIEVTSPVGLRGDVTVEVREAGKPDNRDALILLFKERVNEVRVPTPFCLHIDHRRLRAKRLELKMKQNWVAAQLKYNPSKIGNYELGRWKNPPDDLLDGMARLYGCPLSDFLK